MASHLLNISEYHLFDLNVISHRVHLATGRSRAACLTTNSILGDHLKALKKYKNLNL